MITYTYKASEKCTESSNERLGESAIYWRHFPRKIEEEERLILSSFLAVTT